MSCKSIFVNLGGGGGGSVNTGVLQIAGGVALDSTLRFVEDQAGTDSKLKLSTTNVAIETGSSNGILFASVFGATYTGLFSSGITPNNLNYGMLLDSTGSNYINANNELYLGVSNNQQQIINSNGIRMGVSPLTQNGLLTVKGAGANIVSFRDSSNVEKVKIENTGQLIIDPTYGIQFGSGSTVISAPSNGNLTLLDNAGTSFNRLQFGGTTASFPSIKRSGINIDVRLADDTGYGGITAGRSTEKTLEVLEVNGAMGLGFFNTPAINQPTVAIGEATYASNGGGAIHIDDTIGGYTLQQVVQALQDLGLLA
jgi:hypothetical protein